VKAMEHQVSCRIVHWLLQTTASPVVHAADCIAPHPFVCGIAGRLSLRAMRAVNEVLVFGSVSCQRQTRLDRPARVSMTCRSHVFPQQDVTWRVEHRLNAAELRFTP